MAAVTAEGDGNRFITIAVETSEPVPINRPANNCQKVELRRRRCAGPRRGRRGADQIDGVQTCWASIGWCRRPSTAQLRAGEVYNYTASFGTFLVIVTANPLVVPDQPVAQVNTERARDLLRGPSRR